jgi:hypothetical protein
LDTTLRMQINLDPSYDTSTLTASQYSYLDINFDGSLDLKDVSYYALVDVSLFKFLREAVAYYDNNAHLVISVLMLKSDGTGATSADTYISFDLRLSNFTDKFPTSGVVCDESVTRSYFANSNLWIQGTYIEETGENTYVVNATDAGDGYFKASWEYDMSTMYCDFDLEYVVMMITVDTEGNTAPERIMPFVETTYGVFSHNDEYIPLGTTNSSIVGATNCDMIEIFPDTIQGDTCSESTVLNNAVTPSCTVQCRSGYIVSSSSSSLTYSCDTTLGGAPTLNLICEEIQCDALVLGDGMEDASTATNSTRSTCTQGMILGAINNTSCVVSCLEGYSTIDNKTINGTYECSVFGGLPVTNFSCTNDDNDLSSTTSDDLKDNFLLYIILGGALLIILILCYILGFLCHRRGRKLLERKNELNSGQGHFKTTISNNFDQEAVCTDIVDTRPTATSTSSSLNTDGARNQRALSEVGIILDDEDNRLENRFTKTIAARFSGNKSPAALYLKDSSVFSTPRAASSDSRHQSIDTPMSHDPDEYMDL